MVALQEIHLQIRNAIELGDLARSRRLCDAVLSFCPENLETLLLKAQVDLEAGAYEDAIWGFERVLAGDPEGYVACAGLAIAHEATRDPAAALHWHARALDLSPGNAEIRAERDRLFEQAYPGAPVPEGMSAFAVARSLVDGGRYAEAIEGLRTALSKEPGRLEIRVYLAEILWTCGRAGEAHALCEEILGDAPAVVKAKALLACVAADEGHIEGGRAILAEVHAGDPAGRIGGHLIAQTGLAEWATAPVNIPARLFDVPEREFVSAELPLWAEWMRRALWPLLRLIAPGEEDDRGAALEPKRLLRSVSGPFERWLHERESTRREPVADAPAAAVGTRASPVPGQRPAATQPVEAAANAAGEPGRQNGGSSPAATRVAPEPVTPAARPGRSSRRGSRRKPRPPSPEATDPETTDIIDEPAWVRLRNELRKGRGSR